jgi:hypothetical protein
MNAISRMPYTNVNSPTAYTASHATEEAMGLGPNQLTWLRQRMEAFKALEDRRLQLQEDAVRAARMAGLI